MKILLNVIIIAITGLCTFLGFGLTILFGFAALFMGSPLLGLFLLWIGAGLLNFTFDQISDIELL